MFELIVGAFFGSLVGVYKGDDMRPCYDRIVIASSMCWGDMTRKFENYIDRHREQIPPPEQATEQNEKKEKF